MDELEAKLTGVAKDPSTHLLPDRVDESKQLTIGGRAEPGRRGSNTCALAAASGVTDKPLVDGVITQYDYVYERSALMDYLKQNGLLDYPIDPMMSRDNVQTFPLTDCMQSTWNEDGTVSTAVIFSELQDYDPDEDAMAARRAIPSAMNELLMIETAPETSDDNQSEESDDGSDADEKGTLETEPALPDRCFMCARACVFVSCPSCEVAVYCSDKCMQGHADQHKHHCVRQKPRTGLQPDDPEEVAQQSLEDARRCEKKQDAAGQLRHVKEAMRLLCTIHHFTVFENQDLSLNLNQKKRLMYLEALKGVATASMVLGKTVDARRFARRYLRATGDAKVSSEIEEACAAQDRERVERSRMEAERKRERLKHQIERGLPAGWTAHVPTDQPERVTYRPTWGATSRSFPAQRDRPTREFVLDGRLAKLSGLQSRPKLNGVIVIVKHFVKESGRLKVTVDKKETISVKQEKLEPVPSDEALELVRSLYADKDYLLALDVCEAARRGFSRSPSSADEYNLCNLEGLCSDDPERAIECFDEALAICQRRDVSLCTRNACIIRNNRATQYGTLCATLIEEDPAAAVKNADVALDEFRHIAASNREYAMQQDIFASIDEVLKDQAEARRVGEERRAEARKRLKQKTGRGKKGGRRR